MQRTPTAPLPRSYPAWAVAPILRYFANGGTVTRIAKGKRHYPVTHWYKDLPSPAPMV